MSKKMLIEATHPEETRVVVLDGSRLEELDVETSTKRQIKGNIYLAKVIRVEPSLQAAFVEYGGNRHGFLAFNEIHPDYYQIPASDLEALKKEMNQASIDEEEDFSSKNNHHAKEGVETVSDTDPEDHLYRPKRFSLKKYRIQEVIHHGQIMLVQVTKEERGNKGAAMTTYLSLAGRYTVLMPKNGHSGGVSRKISNMEDRNRLKRIVEDLPVPEGQSIIIRTAGKERTKAQIKKDVEYLNKTWSDIVEKTMNSIAPALIHEEANLIKRTLRDALTDDIEEILIEGEDSFKNAKAFLKLLIPRQARKIKLYKKEIPLFQAYEIEHQMEEMLHKNVPLQSGGYLVIDQAEALVAIDVNSGKATRERNIEETALKTNLEAADEVARQMRLRDLAGLIVIDFIDMDEPKNNYAVERRMKEALKQDRARIQMGKITGFGLMEISRQRLRSSLLETGHHVCPMCQGCGFVRSHQSSAMHALHILEEASGSHNNYTITMTLPLQIALYVLNNKRESLAQIEARHNVVLRIEGDACMLSSIDYRLEYQENPIKEKKNFFVSAVESLFSSMAKEDEKETEKTKPQQEAPKTSTKRSQEKKIQKKPKEKAPKKDKAFTTEEKIKTSAEANFKVIEQSSIQEFNNEQEKENTDKEVKQNTKKKDSPSKGKNKKKKPVKANPKVDTNEDAAKQEAVTEVVSTTVDLLPKEEPKPIETNITETTSDLSKDTTEETPKTGWWAK